MFIKLIKQLGCLKMCLLVGNNAIVEEKKLASQFQQKGFGERSEGEFVLDLYETLYLLEKKKVKVKDKQDKTVSRKKLLIHAEKKIKNFYLKFQVFKNLREKGFCTKTGFKFGFDFRVYPRGKKAGQAHSKWVVNVVSQNEKCNMIGLSRMVRLSGNIRTKMLMAVVDSENDINYYEIERITP